MKTLILNGSPRKKGTIWTLAELARSRTENAELIHVPDCDIRFCRGCMHCRKTGVCSLPEDDGHRIAKKIETADLLIVASPTWWGNMSAPLKNLFDRTVPVFMDENGRGIPIPKQKGKCAIIIAACTTPWPFNILMRQSRGTVSAIREILRTAGYKTWSVEIAGTRNRKSPSPRPAKKLERIIERIARRESPHGKRPQE